MRPRLTPLLAILTLTSLALAEYPPPPKDLAPWPISYTDALPAVSATSLLDKPAGRRGPVVARDGHFYTGDARIRFWGVNLAFGGNFPTHADTDKLAARFAALGINAVRFHHMDNQAFPTGIFADGDREKLSDEALDRLDYFIAALKKQGVYANINLHVSRQWSQVHKLPDADKLDSYDKVVDIFQPELIAANKQYARDLLTHVNKYTGNRYADEPSVCAVEINNENSIFMWGGDIKLADLPPRYADELQKQWNTWLVAKYPTKEKLAAAWNKGATPPGPNLLVGPWEVEAHHGGELKVTGDNGSQTLTIAKVSGTDWHIQYKHPVAVKKGQFYTLSFRIAADKNRKITVGVGQAHEPWENLGLGTPLKLHPENGRPQLRKFGFVATADDDKARVSFVVGQQTGTITLIDAQLTEGGQEGLAADEDPAAGTVRLNQNGVLGSQPRARDWLDFLQHTDEAYWTDMRDFLKKDLGVKAPITGSIVFGPLSAIGQSKMDFVDTHSYWDHPNFPRKSWDSKDWLIDNDAMVDNPAGATLFQLAAGRVEGKPFTVTEYNHAAPNEWTAETIPMIASYAALQDWDAVYLFAYSHNANWNKQNTTGFFDIEGNPGKIPYLPLAARMFLGQDTRGTPTPIETTSTLNPQHQRLLDTGVAYWSNIGRYLREVEGVTWQQQMGQRITLDFDNVKHSPKLGESDSRIRWTSDGPRTGTGRYSVIDANGIAYAGFPAKEAIDLGPVQLTGVDATFVTLMLVPADPGQPIEKADRLLLTIGARSESTDTRWSPDRRSNNGNWGKAPALVQIVKGQLTLPGKWTVKAITPEGTAGDAVTTEVGTKGTTVPLGTTPTLWYELTRQP